MRIFVVPERKGKGRRRKRGGKGEKKCGDRRHKSISHRHMCDQVYGSRETYSRRFIP